MIDPIAGGSALIIGTTAAITGTGFSDVPGDNLICWAGGICQHPDSATGTQLGFTVPPSAVSSPISLTIGGLQSGTVETEVHLAASALSTLRSIGFAKQSGEYWSAGSDGTNHIFRHHYEPATGTWVRSVADNGYGGIHYLSAASDQFGTLYAGLGDEAVIGGTRRVVPPSGAAPCWNLDPPGTSTRVRVLGAAPDPNPLDVAGRDVVYFAVNATVDTTTQEWVYKVGVSATECTGVLDSDFGGRNGVWDWTNPWPIGMAVDGATGQLYISEKTKVSVVDPVTEAVTPFNTQFQRIYGLSV